MGDKKKTAIIKKILDKIAHAAHISKCQPFIKITDSAARAASKISRALRGKQEN